MSTKSQAILEEIRALPQQEFESVYEQVKQMAARTRQPASPSVPVSDEEFEAALEEVSGCTTGSHSLQRLLTDRRRDRERDEAWLEARKRERAHG